MDKAETMMLRIEVVSLGTEERLTVQEEDLVRDVKQRLHEMNPTDVPVPSVAVLQMADFILEDEMTLEECGVANGARIQLTSAGRVVVLDIGGTLSISPTDTAEDIIRRVQEQHTVGDTPIQGDDNNELLALLWLGGAGPNPVNRTGEPVMHGTDRRYTHNYYCGRHVGIAARGMQFTDGCCGPNDGEQCSDCRGLQDNGPLWIQVQTPTGEVRESIPLRADQLVAESIPVDDEGCTVVLCVTGTPKEVEVSGSKLADVNGSYVLTQHRKGDRAVWQHTTSPNTRIQWSTMNHIWMIDWTNGAAPYMAKGPFGRHWMSHQEEWRLHNVSETGFALPAAAVLTASTFFHPGVAIAGSSIYCSDCQGGCYGNTECSTKVHAHPGFIAAP